jgi:hypothetical protein
MVPIRGDSDLFLPVNPNIDPELLAYQRDVMLPAIVKNLKDK